MNIRWISKQHLEKTKYLANEIRLHVIVIARQNLPSMTSYDMKQKAFYLYTYTRGYSRGTMRCLGGISVMFTVFFGRYWVRFPVWTTLSAICMKQIFIRLTVSCSLLSLCKSSVRDTSLQGSDKL